MVIDICDNSSYDEGPLDVWTNSDEEVVALQVDGLASPMSGFEVTRIYENLMDPKVVTMKKEMKFFLSIGLGESIDGLVTFLEMKGQIMSHGLCYEPTEEEKEPKPPKFSKEGVITLTYD